MTWTWNELDIDDEYKVYLIAPGLYAELGEEDKLRTLRPGETVDMLVANWGDDTHDEKGIGVTLLRNHEYLTLDF